MREEDETQKKTESGININNIPIISNPPPKLILEDEGDVWGSLSLSQEIPYTSKRQQIRDDKDCSFFSCSGEVNIDEMKDNSKLYKPKGVSSNYGTTKQFLYDSEQQNTKKITSLQPLEP